MELYWKTGCCQGRSTLFYKSTTKMPGFDQGCSKAPFTDEVICEFVLALILKVRLFRAWKWPVKWTNENSKQADVAGSKPVKARENTLWQATAKVLFEFSSTSLRRSSLKSKTIQPTRARFPEFRSWRVSETKQARPGVHCNVKVFRL